ncbi:MAG TPA: lamin tail domain-containing protein, partial [Pyrinomonadaceae bacterium]
MKRFVTPASVMTLALTLACQSLLLARAPSAVAQKRTDSKSVGVELRDADAPTGAAAQAAHRQKSAPVTAAPAPQSKQAGDAARPTSVRVTGVRTVRVNFKSLVALDARKAAVRSKQPAFQQEIHSPGTIPEVGSEGASQASAEDDATLAPAAEPQDTGGPLVPSPAPAQNFLAQEDGAKVGTGTFTIPPDTMGAVGFDKVFVNVNNNYRVQNKATGAALSTVSIDTFWSSTGATGVFDPRIQFDPYQNRWLLSAVANAQTANSSVLVGVSDTSDPQGTYTLFRIIVGCAPGGAGCNAQGEWADFPMLGFNKNWLAVGWNQFTINTSAFVGGKMLVLDYPTLRTGTATGTLFTNASAATGFCMHPVTTFSATEDTLYVPTHQQSAGALYRLHKITGTPGAPTFTLDATARVRTGGGWTQPGGDNLPQQCVPGVGAPTQTCPATPRGLEASDSFIRSNAVFRNGLIYYPQAIALPAGGLTVASRFAAQWTALNPDGTFNTGGRVEDAAAQIFNGGKHYSYPSLSVNKNNDILLGFSEFESDDYVDAGYTFRLGTDAAGTMRDPVIYKEGEDYYQKTFSGTRNRWGDYSHTVVDPVNDRDLWTVQEYAQLRVGTTGQGSNDSRWGTWWAKITAPAGAGDLLISEFRVRGPNPNGAGNEFIEIYNPNSSALTVTTLDGAAGYAVAASDGVARCVIPSGTIIPARAHYLCVNSVGYSLASHPAGNGTTATGDATYTTDIPDNAGLAIFNTSVAANFALATRLDAVGSTSEANTLYKEGTGYPALTPFSIDYSFYRDNCGKGGSITTLGVCPTGGFPKDTNNNAADFIFVDTNGTSAGAGQRLGSPGPENLSSPVQRNSSFSVPLLDTSVGGAIPPNRVRDFTSDPANNSTFGTLTIRRRVVNNTGAPVTRLRFRVVDQTTFPAPSGFADLRTRTSTLVVVSGVNDPATCLASNGVATTPCTINVQGTTLEQPPSQLNGGAFNGTYSAGTITLGTPLAPG